MVNLSSDDLAQMSDEELSQLQAKLQVAQMKKQLGKKYQTHQAIEALQSQCYLPRRYMLFCDELKELEPSLIVPTVIENEKMIRFPMLMTLASFLPVSSIELRCALVELFDSFILHQGPGESLSSIIPFPVDRVMEICRGHDSTQAGLAIDECYRRSLSLLNTQNDNGNPETTKWIKRVIDGMMFIIHVIAEKNIEYRFNAALKFMMTEPYHKTMEEAHNEVVATLYGPGVSSENRLDNDTIHDAILEQSHDNGSDFAFANRISRVFRIK